MDTEKSISKIDDFIGQKIHVIAFGASYTGILKSVDHEQGVLTMDDGNDTVIIDLERIESYTWVEE